MSAVVVFLEPAAAWMAVDGVTYEYGKGRVDTIQQKAFPLVHLNCAVTVRGPQAYVHKFMPVVNGRFASFEDLVAGLPLVAWVVHEELKDELAERYGNPEVEVYVAGWSHERGRAEAYAISSHDLWGEPWTRLEVDGFACAPGVAPSVETEIPAAVLDVIQRQRLERDGNGHCCVGGHVQIVQITANAVHTSIIHRWPDRIGERLGEAA